MRSLRGIAGRSRRCARYKAPRDRRTLRDSRRLAVPLSMPGMQIARTSCPGRIRARTPARGSPHQPERAVSEHAFGLLREAACMTSDRSLSSIHRVGQCGQEPGGLQAEAAVKAWRGAPRQRQCTRCPPFRAVGAVDDDAGIGTANCDQAAADARSGRETTARRSCPWPVVAQDHAFGASSGRCPSSGCW